MTHPSTHVFGRLKGALYFYYMVIVIDTFKPNVIELIGNLHLDSVEEANEKNMHARCASIKDDSSLLDM